MSGGGYDLTTSTYDNDGQLHQVKYAMKATEKSGTAIGIKCVDGVVLACINIQISPLVVPHTQQRILPVSKHIGMVSDLLLFFIFLDFSAASLSNSILAFCRSSCRWSQIMP